MERKTAIAERIQMLITEFCEGKNLQFAKVIGVNESNIRSYLSGTQPKFDVLSTIASSFAINCEWLLTGRGEMLKSNRGGIPSNLVKTDPLKGENYIPPTAPTGERTIATPTNNPKEGIPLIPIEAMAGALTSEMTVLEYECERYVVPVFKGADFLIPVKGSSMYPKYSSGDIVACQRVPMSDLFFQWNKVYVIDTNQGALIKRIKPGSDKDHVLLVSDNEKYDPFELPFSAIHAVALVLGVIRLE